MLYSENRQDGTQGYHSLIAISVSACIIAAFVTACSNFNANSEAGRISDLRYQLLTDNAQDAHTHLGLFVSNNNDSLQADLMVNRYYKEGGEWVWVDPNILFIEKAEELVAFLEQMVPECGFSPISFFTDDIRSGAQHFRNLDFDSIGISVGNSMALLELNLSKAYIRYALGQRYGFMDPHKVLNRLDTRNEGGYRQIYDINLEKPSDNFVKEVLQHAHDTHPADYLKTLETMHPLYQQLKEMLSTDSTPDGRKRILCNMERLRWRHTQEISLNERHIFVNIPSQNLWAICPDSTFSMKICCGAWKTKTPLLSSNIRLIQLNPEWNIPGSILRDEVSPHAGDSAYFVKNHYFIVHRASGDTIKPTKVTREQLRSGAYRVAQHSGKGNSLGRLIFRFNNQFDVYLHDTNNRNAFNYQRRTISHGCVRVEKPFDLMLFLLGDADEWLLDRIRLSIDMKPESDKGKKFLEKRKEENNDQPIRLIQSTSVNPTVPLLIDYYTLYPNPETGEMETWPDRYEYDTQIYRHIKPFLP